MRRGFTLLELMITIVIIAIMAAMFAGAMYSAQEAAKTERTRALITKINAVISHKMESYRTRRAPITFPSGMSLNQQYAAKLNCIRELMRLEMPDRFSELHDPSDTTNPVCIVYPSPLVTMAWPTGNRSYFRKKSAAATLQYQDAECLYLIVMSDPDDADKFHSSDSNDTDGDGMKEFIDGWGHPIAWIRWPAGFVSEMDSHDTDKDHDPFDQRKIDAEAFSMTPLVFSPGPDGSYELEEGTGTDYVYKDVTISGSQVVKILGRNKTWTPDLKKFFVPGVYENENKDGRNGSLDNITSHLLTP